MEKKSLRGQVVFGTGVIEGNVKVVSDPSQEIFKDEILVVEITNPLYFNQIVNSKAIITDIGGLLCHTAIMAREFGKPCIVGTKNATQILKTGDVIVVNLDKGEINVKSR